MVKPVETLGVCEDGLEFISKLDGHDKARVQDFLSELKYNKSSHIASEWKGIPDDAPSKLKNEAVEHRGKFFAAGHNCSEDCPDRTKPIEFYWYEANDRSVLYIWRLRFRED